MQTYIRPIMDLNFFAIALPALNLFSFMLGMIAALYIGVFSAYKRWIFVVAYFAFLAGYYAWGKQFLLSL